MFIGYFTFPRQETKIVKKSIIAEQYYKLHNEWRIYAQKTLIVAKIIYQSAIRRQWSFIDLYYH